MLAKRSLLVVVATMLFLTALASSVAASSPRSGALDVEKECSTYVGQAGGICTITSSNIGAGSTITYLQAADFTAGPFRLARPATRHSGETRPGQ